MDNPVYELKNWQLQSYTDWIGISGNVYGNPKFEEGFFINTSRIESVEADEKAFLMHTHNSVYHCSFETRSRDAGEGFEELELLTRMGFDAEKAKAVMRSLEYSVREARRKHEETLLSGISANDENVVIIDLTSEDEYYFSAVEVKRGEEKLFSEVRNVHVGQTQNSVEVGNTYGENEGLLSEIRFCYIPHSGNRIDFTEWTSDLGTVYIHNNGLMPMEADTPCGRFVIPPGKCYPITQDSQIGRLSDIDPGSTEEIFNTRIEDSAIGRMTNRKTPE